MSGRRIHGRSIPVRRRVRPAPRIAPHMFASSRTLSLTGEQVEALFYFGRTDLLLRCMDEGVTLVRITMWLHGLVARHRRIVRELVSSSPGRELA